MDKEDPNIQILGVALQVTLEELIKNWNHHKTEISAFDSEVNTEIKTIQYVVLILSESPGVKTILTETLTNY